MFLFAKWRKLWKIILILNLIFKSLSGNLGNYMNILKDSFLSLSLFGASVSQGNISSLC